MDNSYSQCAETQMELAQIKTLQKLNFHPVFLEPHFRKSTSKHGREKCRGTPYSRIIENKTSLPSRRNNPGAKQTAGSNLAVGLLTS